MRKTSLIFLLFAEMAALFLFYNFNQLFIQIGKAEISRIKEHARQITAMASLSAEDAVASLRKNSMFSAVTATRGVPGEEEQNDSNPPKLIIRSQIKNGALIRFTVPIQSQTLSAISKIQSVSTGAIVLGGLLLLVTAITLVVQIRKGKSTTSSPIPIDPLQTYLLNLKDREIKIQQEVDVVRQSAENKKSLTGLILNQVHFAVITLGRGQRIEIFNHKAEQIFQKSYASVVNHAAQDALQDYPDLLLLLKDTSMAGQVKEISCHDLFLSCSATRLPHDGLLLTIEDITGAKENRKLDMEKKSLLQLGEMAAYLSHEVRNSLGVIYGYTKTLKEDDPKIDLINKEIHFLTDMMERFLGFSKPADPPQQILCRTAELVREICVTQNMKLEQQNEPDSEAIADAQLLRNILDNLIRNAAQAGATQINCLYHRDRRSLDIILTDNGQGIPEELMNKIWFPFFTTREKGSGMGLALVRKLIVAMNGEIVLLSSTPGETRFSLRLPINQA